MWFPVIHSILLQLGSHVKFLCCNKNLQNALKHDEINFL